MGSENLKTKYPTLFELETKKRCKVSERIVDSNHVWSWKSRPGDLGLDSAVSALTRDIIDIHLGIGLDHWSCKLSGDGSYSVSCLRKIVDVSQVYIPETSVILWSKVVPIKVTCFIWRAVQARIPTTVALDKRGIAVNSLLCCSCIGAVECSEHVLMNCPFETMIRNNILGWC